MVQTSTIAFALIVGFIVFITVRGELPIYLGVVGLGNKVVTPSTSSGMLPAIAGLTGSLASASLSAAEIAAGTL